MIAISSLIVCSNVWVGGVPLGIVLEGVIIFAMDLENFSPVSLAPTLKVAPYRMFDKYRMRTTPSLGVQLRESKLGHFMSTHEHAGIWNVFRVVQYGFLFDDDTRLYGSTSIHQG